MTLPALFLKSVHDMTGQEISIACDWAMTQDNWDETCMSIFTEYYGLPLERDMLVDALDQWENEIKKRVIQRVINLHLLSTIKR